MDASAKELGRLCILGTGQLGCSLAALARETGRFSEIVGVDRRTAHLEMALRLSLIDRGLAEPGRGVLGANVVVLAVPLPEVFGVLTAAGPDIRPDALVTDLAGTTARVSAQVEREIGALPCFVPAFPMVHSQRIGPGGASADVLRGASVLLSRSAPPPALERAGRFFQALGLSALVVDGELFEWCVAGTHYLPQLVVSCLRQVVRRAQWPLGQSALKRMLDSDEVSPEQERAFQLHAGRLSGLLDELVQAMGQRQRRLGSQASVPPPSRSRRRPVIAIDGPAGTGKSTVARRVARALGYLLVDTGAIYRCLALQARWAGVEETDEAALAERAAHLPFRFEERGEERRVWLGSEDVTQLIREPAISQAASRISALPAVRRALLEVQRDLGREGGVVLEGRDIGTVVFPDAEVKVFLEAPLAVRARRRFDELRAAGKTCTLEEVEREVKQRDERDEKRAVAPLVPAADAIRIDTGPLSLDLVVEAVLEAVRQKAP
jgi:cytidylate kinase